MHLLIGAKRKYRREEMPGNKKILDALDPEDRIPAEFILNVRGFVQPGVAATLSFFNPDGEEFMVNVQSVENGWTIKYDSGFPIFYEDILFEQLDPFFLKVLENFSTTGPVIATPIATLKVLRPVWREVQVTITEEDLRKLTKTDILDYIQVVNIEVEDAEKQVVGITYLDREGHTYSARVYPNGEGNLNCDYSHNTGGGISISANTYHFMYLLTNIWSLVFVGKQ